MPSVHWSCWLGVRKGIQPVKKPEWSGAGVVVCLEQGADLHMAQLMPLPLTVSCCSKMQIGFTFLVLAHLGSPGHRAVKRVCVCVKRVAETECHGFVMFAVSIGLTKQTVTSTDFKQVSWNYTFSSLYNVWFVSRFSDSDSVDLTCLSCWMWY